MSKSIIPLVNECWIKPSVQSKLFDRKAIILDIKTKRPASSRPTISTKILRDPDLDFVVRLAIFDCYGQHLVNDNIYKN